MADLVFTPEGHVVVPGAGPHALTALAKRQLAPMVGIRWERWFQSASAEELNRRLKRRPGERKLRAWVDATGATAGTLRAILPPSYEPIDDLRIFESLRSNMGALLGEYRLQRVEAGEGTSQYAAVLRDSRVLRGDELVPGWSLRTSEIGQAPLSIDDYWLRLVCMNGLMVAVGGKRSLYRRHHAVDDDQLGAAFVLALGRLPGRFERALELMATAMDAVLEHPDAIAASVLAGITRPLVEEVQRAALAEAPISRFGLLNVITRVAHTTNQVRDGERSGHAARRLILCPTSRRSGFFLCVTMAMTFAPNVAILMTDARRCSSLPERDPCPDHDAASRGARGRLRSRCSSLRVRRASLLFSRVHRSLP